MTQASDRTGLRGEQIAHHFLRGKGFRIEASNWRKGKAGEIDLIGFHPIHRILVFVEVKTRRSLSQGSPYEAVDQRKINQILRLAEWYLSAHCFDPDVSVRFDVIAIYFAGNGKPAEITHIENAFSSDFSGV